MAAPAGRYFDNTSNGFYYQHSGTQGWKRSSGPPAETGAENVGPAQTQVAGFTYSPNGAHLDDHLQPQHSVVTFVGAPNPTPVPTTVFAAISGPELGFLAQQFVPQLPVLPLGLDPQALLKQQRPDEAVKNDYSPPESVDVPPTSDFNQSPDSNAQLNNSTTFSPTSTQHSTMPASATQYRQHPGGRNGPIGKPNDRERGERETSTSNANPNNVNHAGPNGAQWHGHPRQNGQFKRPYNKNNSDYWNKNGPHYSNAPNRDNAGGPKRNDENVGPSNAHPDNKSRAMYQRSDRWQARHHQNHPSAPVSVQRGPLPDWDEVAEAAGNDGAFDYMDLMESQYNQIYAMMQMPPFDPSIQVKGAAAAGAIPGYMVPIMSNAQWGFRPSIIVPQQAGGMPMPAMQTVGAMPQTSNVDKRFKGPPQQQPMGAQQQQSPPVTQAPASPSTASNKPQQQQPTPMSPPASSAQSTSQQPHSVSTPPQQAQPATTSSGNQPASSSDSRPDSVASSH
ncbi:La-related protein 1 [Aphelenchoides fujianensis]|nr:La-related protein 1 [Aphelenchoides fujianensis]